MHSTIHLAYNGSSGFYSFSFWTHCWIWTVVCLSILCKFHTTSQNRADWQWTVSMDSPILSMDSPKKNLWRSEFSMEFETCSRNLRVCPRNQDLFPWKPGCFQGRTLENRGMRPSSRLLELYLWLSPKFMDFSQVYVFIPSLCISSKFAQLFYISADISISPVTPVL